MIRAFNNGIGMVAVVSEGIGPRCYRPAQCHERGSFCNRRDLGTQKLSNPRKMGIKTYLPLLISFFLSVCATPIVRMAAIKKGWMAVPVKDRWHKKPTALMGGIAIYIGFALPLAFYADFTTIFPNMRPRGFVSLPDINAAIFVGITLCFILGLLDDYLHIKPQPNLWARFLWHPL